MTDDLHSKLRRAVPDPGPGRLGRRGPAPQPTRRSVTAGGVAVTALALMLAIGWPALTGRRAVPAASPAAGGPSIPAATPGGDHSDACEGLTPSTSTEVPTGADQLRLCPTGESDGRIFAPLDALVRDHAHDVLAVLTSQPRNRPDQPCNADLGPDFLLVAETGGQAPVVMVLQLYGCRTVGLRDDPRTGANAVYDAFIAALTLQRAQIDRPPIERAGDVCRSYLEGATSVMPVGTPHVLWLCVYADTAATARTARLTRSQAQRVTDDLAANSSPGEATCPVWPPGDLHRLAIVGFHGDVLQLTRSCEGKWTYTDERGARVWTPSAALANRLDQWAKA